MSQFNLATVDPKQLSYDHYNNFIFDSNIFIFHKMATRINFFNKIKDLPGDIIECGVFKGSGIVLWGKMLMMHSPHDARKVLGFDFFSEEFCLSTIKDIVDKDNMKKVFSRCDDVSGISIDAVREAIVRAGIPEHKFELIKGDLTKTANEIVTERPGLRISLLYMDVDIDEPTYEALHSFWNRMSIGGIIVFDEYAIHVWSESNAVDRFIKEKGISLHKTNVVAPSAYIIKE